MCGVTALAPQKLAFADVLHLILRCWNAVIRLEWIIGMGGVTALAPQKLASAGGITSNS